MKYRIKRGNKYAGYVFEPIRITQTEVVGRIKLSRFVRSEPVTYKVDQLLLR